MRARNTAGLVLTSMLLSGCQFDPYAHEYTRAKPKEESLVGRYAADDESRNLFQRAFKMDVGRCELDLMTDATFELRNVPDCWRRPDCSGKVETAAGTWKLCQIHEWWSLVLRTQRIDGLAVDWGSEAMLRGEDVPYLIHFIIGDPDSGRGLALERKR